MKAITYCRLPGLMALWEGLNFVLDGRFLHGSSLNFGSKSMLGNYWRHLSRFVGISIKIHTRDSSNKVWLKEGWSGSWNVFPKMLNCWCNFKESNGWFPILIKEKKKKKGIILDACWGVSTCTRIYSYCTFFFFLSNWIPTCFQTPMRFWELVWDISTMSKSILKK